MGNAGLSDGSLSTRSGVRLISTQKPIKRPGWWKGKFALFWMLATKVGRTPVQRLTPPALTVSEQELFILFCLGLCCRACEILVPRLGLESQPTTVKAWSLKHWTTSEISRSFYRCREGATCRNSSQHWQSSWNWSLVVWPVSSWLF